MSKVKQIKAKEKISQKIKEIILNDIEKSQLVDFAKDKIRNLKLNELDPTLGDQACHLRAYQLLNIARKLKENPDILFSTDEENFLASIIVMKACNTSAVDCFGFEIKCYSQNRLPDLLNINATSDAIKNFIHLNRENLVNQSIQYLKDTINQFATLAEYQEYASILLNPESLGQVIRVNPKEKIYSLPLFAVGKVIFANQLMDGKPILVTIRRLLREFNNDEPILSLQGIAVIMLKPNMERTKFEIIIPSDQDKTEPALNFNCLSIVNAERLVQTGLKSPNFDEYLEALKSEDKIMDFLLYSHAIHPQYPALREAKLAIYEEEGNNSMIACEYRKYKDEGKNQFKVIENPNLYHRLPNIDYYKKVTEAEISLAIDHIHADCFNRAVLRAQELIEHTRGKFINGVKINCPGKVAGQAIEMERGR